VIWGVLQFPGSCDERDALNACEVVGGEARLIWHEERDLSGVDGVVVPGGFSYGDYLRAGAIARFSPAMEAVAELAAAGGPVLGICNGFQVLCEAGLLPGALLRNQDLRFICKQADLVAIPAHPAVDGPKTGDIGGFSAHQHLSIPMKHGEGRYYAPEEMLDALEANGQVAYRYADGHNANGSVRDIAGVRNDRGNVVGLMPHPEHAVDPLTGSIDGRQVFEALEGFAS
jgi:phosphoribosylformylglycinamidine synthase subunit PurQ / glutaminase